MRFIVYIINVVESRGVIKVQHLRSILNIPLNGCFPFGYPNLPSLIQAFQDIFVSTGGKQITYRTEIKINSQCICK